MFCSIVLDSDALESLLVSNLFGLWRFISSLLSDFFEVDMSDISFKFTTGFGLLLSEADFF